MLLPATPPPLCSMNHVAAVVHVDRISDANRYWIEFAARTGDATRGTLRLITGSGHIDVPFSDPGPLEVTVPNDMLVLGAYAIRIGAADCEAAAPIAAGPEIADDALRCDHPFTDAEIIDAAIPVVPAYGEYEHGTVSVSVQLDERGNVVQATIRQSDSLKLNASAVSAARRTKYAPATELCRGIGGSYLFTTTFR